MTGYFTNVKSIFRFFLKRNEFVNSRKMSSEEYKGCENEDIENSDESDRPSGERWAPVGANDGDNDFADEYKYADNIERCVSRISANKNIPDACASK